MFAFFSIPLLVLISDACASQDCSKAFCLHGWLPMSTCFADTSTPFPYANCNKTSVSSLLRMAPAEIGIQGLPQMWSHTAASPRTPHPWALCPGNPGIQGPQHGVHSLKSPNLCPQPFEPTIRSTSSFLGILTGLCL